MLGKRRSKRVCVVRTFGNALFQASRPNTERHAVWDGWAVRRETAPVHVAEVPGRELLFRRSHAVFALRRWWYRRSEPRDTLAPPSTGTWRGIAPGAPGPARGGRPAHGGE